MNTKKQNSTGKLSQEFYKGGFIDVSELKDTKPTLLGNLEVY